MIRIINSKDKILKEGVSPRNEIFSEFDFKRFRDRCNEMLEGTQFIFETEDPEKTKSLYSVALRIDKKMREYVCNIQYTHGVIIYLRKNLGHEKYRYKFGSGGPLNWESKIMNIVQDWAISHPVTFGAHYGNWNLRNTTYRGFDIVFLECADGTINKELIPSTKYYFLDDPSHYKKKFVTLKQAMDKAIAEYTKTYLGIQQCFFSRRSIEHGFFNAMISRYGKSHCAIDVNFIRQFRGSEYFTCIIKYIIQYAYEWRNPKYNEVAVRYEDVEVLYHKIRSRIYRYLDEDVCRQSEWLSADETGD